MKNLNKYIPILAFLFISSCGESSLSQKEIPKGTITGTVTDAEDGATISGATLYVYGYQSDTETTTASDGTFTISNAPEGDVTIYSSKTEYITTTASSSVTADTTTSNVGVPMTKTSYGSGYYVVSLQWYSAKDIDAHLLVPIDGSNCSEKGGGVSGSNYNHVDWKNLCKDCGDAGNATSTDPYAALDLDDTDGISAGPTPASETIRIKISSSSAKCTGTYKFFVYHFNTIASGETFSTTKAVVKIYKDGGLINSAKVTDATVNSSSGRVWQVFTLSGSTVTIDNKIESTCYSPSGGDNCARSDESTF